MTFVSKHNVSCKIKRTRGILSRDCAHIFGHDDGQTAEIEISPRAIPNNRKELTD